ncbi:MAG: formylglycine-generating enzyme family protein, partial [Verrucomicrobiota bacterium]
MPNASSTTQDCELPRHVLWEGLPHEMAFRELPKGRFRMGARGEYSGEEPRHWVEITRPFWMAETPVTQLQYAYMAEQCRERLEKIKGQRGVEPSGFKDKSDHHPVERVGWYEARLMGTWLSGQADMLPEGVEARLPTEAEWEYACRAGTETDYYSGDGAAAVAEVGWFRDNSGSRTHLVKERKRPNANGLHDMHGNVWEWCLDVWDETAYFESGAVAADPLTQGPLDAPRVLRGGSWNYAAGLCRSAFRIGFPPGCRYRDDGFRLCLSSGPVKNSQASVGPE